MKQLEITKIIKLTACNDGCQYFDYVPKGIYKSSRFVCNHPLFRTKFNGHKIISRKCPMYGSIPSWCPLEDYKEADHEAPA